MSKLNNLNQNNFFFSPNQNEIGKKKKKKKPLQPLFLTPSAGVRRNQFWTNYKNNFTQMM